MIGIIFGIDSSVFSTLQCIVFIGHIYGERMYKAIAKFKMATMTRIRDGPTEDCRHCVRWSCVLVER